jgi:hypothetical protein
MPASQLGERSSDVCGEQLEGGAVGVWANAQDEISRKIRWKQVEAAQFAEAALEAIPSHGRLLVAWHHEPDARSRSGRTRKRGSGSSDLEMRGPDALPLSRDALNFRTPRYTCLPRKTE